MNQILGHEFGHILFGHIPDRILLTLIFYATAKNLIPAEDEAAKGKKVEGTDSRADKDRRSLSESRGAMLDRAVDYLVRELIPHAGKTVSAKPEFVSSLRLALQQIGDRMAQEEPALVLQTAKDVLKASRAGLPGGEKEPEVSKEAEKQFMEDLDRFSRSCETSCDRAGFWVNFMLSPDLETAMASSFMAYARLVGSESATYHGMKAQYQRIGIELAQAESRARFRRVGKSHPNTMSRALQFEGFSKSEAFRVLSDPFLTALTDYIALTHTLIELDAGVQTPAVRELYDRVSDQVVRTELAVFLRNLSDWIQEVVLTELAEVQAGKSKNVSATIILLETMAKVVDDGDMQGFIPSLRDYRDELGKPKRLLTDLRAKLEERDRSTASELAAALQTAPDGATLLAIEPPAPGKVAVARALGFMPLSDQSEGSHGKTLYRLVIEALDRRIPGIGIAADSEAILGAAGRCATAMATMGGGVGAGVDGGI